MWKSTSTVCKGQQPPSKPVQELGVKTPIGNPEVKVSEGKLMTRQMMNASFEASQGHCQGLQDRDEDLQAAGHFAFWRLSKLMGAVLLLNQANGAFKEG